MENDFQNAAKNIFGNSSNVPLSDKKSEIEKLANSSDGQMVKEILDKNGTDLESAVKNGDMDALRYAVSDILKTDAGARLYKQLNDMMK